jgi:hypothetical protein
MPDAEPIERPADLRQLRLVDRLRGLRCEEINNGRPDRYRAIEPTVGLLQ